jgi:hypothetical protein
MLQWCVSSPFDGSARSLTWAWNNDDGLGRRVGGHRTCSRSARALPACGAPPSDYYDGGKAVDRPTVGANRPFPAPGTRPAPTIVWDRERARRRRSPESTHPRADACGASSRCDRGRPEHKVAVAADLTAGKRYYVLLSPRKMG